ncbi:hypothetical protein C265_29525 [Cupriavidus sp. GA3-3]|uniref:hypothetical protein n=1 Tax=Cupriavidus TaxID=106589 RepID=UPI0003311792|nr:MULTISPECIES: hypothetical protein [Cupriavidus]EON16028.1 hypothetical protein C265_29525 [Cupriavidus sp. GA3-3]
MQAKHGGSPLGIYGLQALAARIVAEGCEVMVLRWLFLLPSVLLPASLIGLSLFHIVAAPTRDDMFVGYAGVVSAAVLLADLILVLVWLGALGYLLWTIPDQRRSLLMVAGIAVVASVACYALDTRVIRVMFSVAAA